MLLEWGHCLRQLFDCDGMDAMGHWSMALRNGLLCVGCVK